MSATSSTCDHRVYHVVVVALVINGLVVGIGFVALGQTPFTAAASGGAALPSLTVLA
ncbi:hypothetical protein AB0K68_25015 [Streptomyces sp. NPDC050698]